MLVLVCVCVLWGCEIFEVQPIFAVCGSQNLHIAYENIVYRFILIYVRVYIFCIYSGFVCGVCITKKNFTSKLCGLRTRAPVVDVVW